MLDRIEANLDGVTVQELYPETAFLVNEHVVTGQLQVGCKGVHLHK